MTTADGEAVAVDEMTPDATAGIIPYKNPAALAAYYMGVFSVIPLFGFFLAPAAIICGIIGLRKKKQYPNAKGSVHAWIGIVCGGLLFPLHLLGAFGIVSALFFA